VRRTVFTSDRSRAPGSIQPRYLSRGLIRFIRCGQLCPRRTPSVAYSAKSATLYMPTTADVRFLLVTTLRLILVSSTRQSLEQTSNAIRFTRSRASTPRHWQAQRWVRQSWRRLLRWRESNGTRAVRIPRHMTRSGPPISSASSAIGCTAVFATRRIAHAQWGGSTGRRQTRRPMSRRLRGDRSRALRRYGACL
jgi:hypothetical protein